MRVNLKDVPVNDGNFEPIPAGLYELLLVDFKEKTSKQGNAYMNCQFAITDGQFKKRRIFDKFMLNEKSFWRLKMYALAIGLGEKINAEVELNDIFTEGLQVPVKVMIGVREGYNSPTENFIDRYINDTSAPKVVNDNEMGQIDVGVDGIPF